MTARARGEGNQKSAKFVPYHDVDSFISTSSATIWPCSLPNHHRQLKNYISTAVKDTIFYLSSHYVYAVHIPTNRQVQVTTVSFQPTCLTAGHGWVCVGAYSTGKCAFIDLRNCNLFGLAEDTTRELHSAEVDELLPLDLDVNSRPLRDSHVSAHTYDMLRRRPKVIHEEIGRMIVNGITISKFTHDQENLPDETVAVVANNDKTITIYSLTQQLVLKTIHLSKEVNHASISPDGELMVAVGDINKVWFFRRMVRKHFSRHKIYDWTEIATVTIHNTNDKDWSFSTAWSPSGHICMVASQFGVITTFDSSKIHEDLNVSDAILSTMNSSRPSNPDPHSIIPGAPRSMAFSPEPWDLVAWAEDHGRVTVADLRDRFDSRQTIEIDANSDKLEVITFIPVDLQELERERERERATTLIRQHRDALDSNDAEAAVGYAAAYMEDAAIRRRARTTSIYANGEELPSSILSEPERELLELMQSNAARDPSRRHSPSRPYSINYANRAAAMSASQPLTFGQYLVNRSHERQGSWTTPRRRGSIVVSHNTAERTARTSAAHPSSLIPGLTAPLSASPSRLSDTDIEPTISTQISTSEPSEAHRTRNRRLTNDVFRLSHLRSSERGPGLEALLRWRAIQPGADSVDGELRDLADANEQYQEQARTLGRRMSELRDQAGQLSEGFDALSNDGMSFLDDVTSDIMLGRETISTARTTLARSGIDEEASIQGIGWSWDGRWLIVGTEAGILKYKVNLQARMRFPALYMQ